MAFLLERPSTQRGLNMDAGEGSKSFVGNKTRR